MLRFAVRSLLVTAFVVSVGVVVFALYELGTDREETWAVIAASLAVVTSVASSWSAQRVMELEEDARTPEPIPLFDTTSRSHLLQLRISNIGGGVARNIRLSWDRPLLNTKNEPVSFVVPPGRPDVEILLPGQSVAVLIGATHVFYQTNKDTRYSGAIEFEDSARRKYKRSFLLSGEQYRKSLTYETEEHLTHEQIQKLPKELQSLTREIAQIRMLLDSGVHDNTDAMGDSS